MTRRYHSTLFFPEATHSIMGTSGSKSCRLCENSGSETLSCLIVFTTRELAVIYTRYVSGMDPCH